MTNIALFHLQSKQIPPNHTTHFPLGFHARHQEFAGEVNEAEWFLMDTPSLMCAIPVSVNDCGNVWSSLLNCYLRLHTCQTRTLQQAFWVILYWCYKLLPFYCGCVRLRVCTQYSRHVLNLHNAQSVVATNPLPGFTQVECFQWEWRSIGRNKQICCLTKEMT